MAMVLPDFFSTNAEELRFLAALVSTTAIVVWRVAVVQLTVRVQNGRIGKTEQAIEELERNRVTRVDLAEMVTRPVCSGLHEQTVRVVERIETRLGGIDASMGQIHDRITANAVNIGTLAADTAAIRDLLDVTRRARVARGLPPDWQPKGGEDEHPRS